MITTNATERRESPAGGGPPSGAGLRLDRVRAGYGRTTVLDSVTLSVGPGEVVTLVGANGVGKTTATKLALGHLRPSAGTVTYDGRAVGSPQQAIRQGMAYVPEGRHLFPTLTVAENLSLGQYGCRRRDRPRRQGALDVVCEVFPQIPALLSRDAGNLSGGQQQMVAIGRALMRDPSLLVLDEPSLGLAPIAIEAVFSSLRVIVASGRSVLLVEQYVERALDVADRAYVMRAGAIVAQDDAARLACDPERVEQAYFGRGDRDDQGASR